jgi:hypothetical protein
MPTVGDFVPGALNELEGHIFQDTELIGTGNLH